MMKKLTARILVVSMLASLSFTVGAEETTERPSVEEILNNYHQRAFEAEMQGGEDTAATWSRSGGSEITLEQETVEELTEAGYEAYNVTGDNYDTLEAELNTDFADMGLDPDGNYIVVINGGTAETQASAGARVSPDMGFDQVENGDGYPATYTYNGVTYSVRYITVTSEDDSDLKDSVDYYVREKGSIPEAWAELAEFTITSGADALTRFPVLSVLSLLIEMSDDSTVTPMEPGDLMVHAKTSWTRYFIQVQSIHDDIWYTRQCSESALSVVHLSGWVQDKASDDEFWFHGSKSQFMTYSPDYHNINDRLHYAMICNAHGGISHDSADVTFYFDGENAVGDPYYRSLFTQWSPSL